MTFIGDSPRATDSPTLISHLIFTKTSCEISSFHSAPGETNALQWRWVWSREPIKENHTEDSRDYFDWKHITLFRTSNLFWSCQYFALNLLIPIGERLGRNRERYIRITRGVFPRHAWPLFPWKVGQYKDKGLGLKTVCPQRERCCLLLSSWLHWRFKCKNVSTLLCPNLDCWDVSSHASPFHNDILVLLIQPHPYTLKILILPWCLQISNICSPLKRYQAHGEIEVHIWKT